MTRSAANPRDRSFPEARGGGRRAFTLIEVMAVMVIVAIMLVAVVPALDGLVPSYRMTAQARTVASYIEIAQSEAVGRRVEILVAYNLDEESFWLIMPKQAPPGQEEPKEEEEGKSKNPETDDLEHGKAPPDPNAKPKEGESAGPSDFSDRDALEPTKLPRDVDLAVVVVEGKERRSGIVYVPFTHEGNEGSHVVGLKLKQDQRGGGEQRQTEIWVKFNALTRTIEYHDSRPQTRQLGGSTAVPSPPGGSK